VFCNILFIAFDVVTMPVLELCVLCDIDAPVTHISLLILVISIPVRFTVCKRARDTEDERTELYKTKSLDSTHPNTT